MSNEVGGDCGHLLEYLALFDQQPVIQIFSSQLYNSGKKLRAPKFKKKKEKKEEEILEYLVID